MHRPDFVFRRDGISIRPYRCTLPTKKATILILNEFCSVLCSLMMYLLAKKEGNFLLMYPLFGFPYLRTLRAVFSETMRFYAGLIHLLILIDIPFRRVRGCDNHPKSLLMHPSVTSTPPSAFAGFESLARRFPKICGEIFLSNFSSSLL